MVSAPVLLRGAQCIDGPWLRCSGIGGGIGLVPGWLHSCRSCRCPLVKVLRAGVLFVQAPAFIRLFHPSTGIFANRQAASRLESSLSSSAFGTANIGTSAVAAWVPPSQTRMYA